MIYVWYGDDDFTIKQWLDGLKKNAGVYSLREANVTEFDGHGLNMDHLESVCRTIPFMVERRLVVVRGFLGSVEGSKQKRRGGRNTVRIDSGRSSKLTDAVSELPSSTDLVFVDGKLSKSNAILTQLAGMAQIKEFTKLRGSALHRWIQGFVSENGGQIEPGAIKLLSELVGGNLWSLSMELEKLTIYCGDRPVRSDDVRLLTTVSREANIFATIDAVIEGRIDAAHGFLAQLYLSGATVPYILAMLARQLRQLVVASELLGKGFSNTQVGQRLGIKSDFVLRKTLNQAMGGSIDKLATLYLNVLETDVAIKTGQVQEELGVTTLISKAAAFHFIKS